MFRSIYESTGVSIGLSNSGTNSLNYATNNNTFWTSSGQVNEARYFQLYVESPYSFNNPVLYYSTYAPRTQQSMCNSGSYLVCRAYNSFFSRRYFLVAQRNGNTQILNISDTVKFPQSD